MRREEVYIPTYLDGYNKAKEDFESRTCDNCKHYRQEGREDYGWCEPVIKSVRQSIVEKDFGCLKFGRIEL